MVRTRYCKLRFLFIFSLLVESLFSEARAFNGSPFSFAQLTAEQGPGTRSSTSGSGIKYETDRVRVGYNFKSKDYFGRLHLALERVDIAQQNELPNLIHDIFAGFNFTQRTSLQLGQYKTPLGMDFHESGADLDIVKRGMDVALIINRSIGLMLKQKLTDNITLELGHFNPAKRSSAISSGTPGTDSAQVGRIIYKSDDERFHIEASYGGSTKAGGSGSKDYHVYDIGFKKFFRDHIFKGEYIRGVNIRGLSGRWQEVAFLHYTYILNESFELTLRPYFSKSKISQVETELYNIFWGFNYQFPKVKGIAPRLQLNHVLTSGDKSQFSGLGGYRDNAVLALFQVIL